MYSEQSIEDQQTVEQKSNKVLQILAQKIADIYVKSNP